MHANAIGQIWTQAFLMVRGGAWLAPFVSCLAMLILAQVFVGAEADAASCSTCGGAGQRACCAFPIDGDGLTACSTCESGLLKILGCDGDCGFLDCSLHTCYARSACGADGQRACCQPPFENAGPACDAGLAEFTPCNLGFGNCVCSEVLGGAIYSSGVCRPTNCGGPDERACCLLGTDRVKEGISGPCRAGLIEKGDCDSILDPAACQCSGALTGFIQSEGVCIDPLCGGENERACCVNEQLAMGLGNCIPGLVEIPGCDPGSDCSCKGLLGLGFSSSGTCHKPTFCGGDGDRACCIAERQTPCDTGLVEVIGCTGDCFCGAGLGNVAGLSESSCAKFNEVAEPEIGFIPPPAPPAGTCSMAGYADLHMHLFADIAHGAGVLAGSPCPTDDTTYCPEAFTSRPLGPGGCVSKTYCDQSLRLDVNDALKACFGTDRDLVTKNGEELFNPESGFCGVLGACPCEFPQCGGKHLHGHHTLFDDAVGSPMGTLDGSEFNIGAPAFTAWPQWTTTTHQQAYYRWLERAWRGGLRLIVQMAVQNTALCETNKRLRNVDCSDSMAFVNQQLQAAYDFENFIDRVAGNGVDNNGGWFRIVLTPTQARRVIGEGKMAVVLGIEVDHLFNCKFPSHQCTHTDNNQLVECTLTLDNDTCVDPDDPAKSSEQWVREQVDYYHDVWGVRHMFPIHNFDNSFGGTATWQSAIEVGNRFIEGHWYATQDECADEGYGFKLGEDGAVMQFIAGLFGFGDLVDVPVRDEEASCNLFGLFPLGKTLVNRMMDRGMMVDIDHMSNRSLDDTIELAQARGGYPLAATHTLFFNLNQTDITHERMRTSAQLAAMNAMGSMVGVMLKDDILDRGTRGQRKTIDYAASGLVDDCRHSSKTFAQMYTYAVDRMGGRVGMGSDFNGVAGHFGPRFGSDACGGDGGERSAQMMEDRRLEYPFTLEGFGSFRAQVSGPKTFDYNTIGLAHVGLLPDFVADLQRIGLSPQQLAPLFRSAEEYVRMWELARGETVREGCLADCRTDDTTAPAIVCPADPVVECGGAETAATFAAPVASEACSTATAPTCSPASGTGFAPGTTPVTCTSTDESGNTGTCVLNVVVADTTPPVIAAPADLRGVECASPEGAAPALGSAATADACDPAPVVTNDASVVFPLGQTTVTWTALDAAGLSAGATQEVEVVDTTPPTIACPDDVTAECTGGGVAAVPVGSATGDDVCGAVAFSSDSPGTFPLGVTTVTHTATDAQGLATTCPQSVSVVDTTPPRIQCPAPATLECTGGHGASFTPVAAVVADVCAAGGGPAVTVSQPPAGVFPLGTTRLGYSATDGAGLTTSCDTSVTVEDTTRPAIVAIGATPNRLWPPDHRMVTVAVEATAADTCDPTPPACAITEITSDEPVNGLGDGDTSPDWEITGPLTANLRAERSGRHDDGAAPSDSAFSGRVYTLLVACTDEAGNSSSTTTFVTVPNDRRKR
jgi:microsomal dipeptidase-like Zn-dependent dipeptidase